jgi:hypothetical protein
VLEKLVGESATTRNRDGPQGAPHQSISVHGISTTAVDGFAGLRDEDGGELSLHPAPARRVNAATLPTDRPRAPTRGRMTTDRTTCSRLDGSGLSVVSSGETVVLEPGKPISVTAAEPAAAAVGN